MTLNFRSNPAPTHKACSTAQDAQVLEKMEQAAADGRLTSAERAEIQAATVDPAVSEAMQE